MSNQGGRGARGGRGGGHPNQPNQTGGRGRPQPQQYQQRQQPQQPQQRPQQQQQRPQQAPRAAPPPATSAWGQPAAPPSAARAPPAPQQQRAPVAQPTRAVGASANAGLGTASVPQEIQGVGAEGSRGSVRGKRTITEVVHSRPAHAVSKIGTIGVPVSLQTNYYRVLKKPEWSVHQYRVDFSPDTDSIGLRRALLGHFREMLGGYIFDGFVLFCSTYFREQLVNGQMELITKKREGDTVQIKIKHVGIVEPTESQQLQVLNLLLRRAMEGLDLQLVGRNFFDPKAKILMDTFHLELWPGYTTSIRQHEADILLCAEIAHKVMRTETCYNILTQCTREAQDYHDAFKREVVEVNGHLQQRASILKSGQSAPVKYFRMIVLTDYNNKTYRIDDVNFEASPRSTFKTKDSEISYLEYYKTRYNINIRDQKQPMLMSRPSERNMRAGQTEVIYLVPELCRPTGLTDQMRNNFQLMKAMGNHTRLTPDRRIERLAVFNRRLKESKTSTAVLNSWNVQLDTNLVEVPGRILPPEKIVFGGGKRYLCDKNADWTREFRNTSMYLHVDIKRWTVIVQRRSVRDIQNFVGMCINAAKGMRMLIAEPIYEEIPDDRNGTISQAIENCASKDPQILMVVLNNKNTDKYSCVKKKCCVDRPVPSQVVTLRTVAPARGGGGLMSVATKVVIQMNAKLMGAPWMIEVPLPGIMTVGFDVCHSGKDKNKSYGAFVATMDMKTSTKYYTAVNQHLRGQELSNEVTVHMTCALKAYKDTHGVLPERILFFRDGVGDGQLHQVANTEVKHLVKKLDEIYKMEGKPEGCRIAFIVVSKRINTRYFYNRQNPVPGTVIDDVITLPERYDFFLVSQSVGQGTVSPTSYNIIYDTIRLPAERIQMLTYKMCHMYYNFSASLRVPAVCQYAHKLAFLVAESIYRNPSNALENQLYFL